MADRRQSLDDILGGESTPDQAKGGGDSAAPAGSGSGSGSPTQPGGDASLAYDDSAEKEAAAKKSAAREPAGGGAGARNVKSTAAVGVGAIAVLGSIFPPAGILLGITAIVLGVLARKEIASGPTSGARLALTGIALGSIGLLAGLIFLFFNVL